MIEYIKAVLSENGMPSSKRWIGLLIVVTVLIGWSYSVYANGMGEHETDLAEVLVITAGTLLGVTTVARAFSKSNDQTSTDSQQTSGGTTGGTDLEG